MAESLEILAHIDRESGRRQTLSEHSRHVADECGRACGKIGLGALGKLTGLLHDSGKGALAFQRYLRGGDAAMRGKIPHSFCGARYCWETWGTKGGIAPLTAQLASAAVCGHHSGLPDMTEPGGEDGLLRRTRPEGPSDYEEALQNYFNSSFSREVLEELFRRAQGEVAKLGAVLKEICERVPKESRSGMFSFLWGMVQRYLMSCLIDADRYDTYLFEADQAPEPQPEPGPLWHTLAGRLEEHLADLPSQGAVGQKRREISGRCLTFAPHGRGIYRLSVPTGSGKTLSSLRYALACAENTGKERIFYVAPYKSILDQNAKDIRDALGLGGRNVEILLEHHGDVVFEGREEEVRRRDLLTQRWNAPVVLTTTVQFLNTLFDGRGSCVRRMRGLGDAVILLDEVQAVPIRCTYLLNAALDFLAYVCGCSIVLCTATQPAVERMDIPVLLGEPAEMVPDLEEAFASLKRTRAVDKTGLGPLPAERLADFCIDRLEGCGNLLAVLNTKSAAEKLYRALRSCMEVLPEEERIPLFLLTTNLCPKHRVELIEEIRKALAGKTGNNRLICVSTQLIEAGVNLSFQCVVRSLAGLDSVTQAAGRCNRHGEADSRDVFIVRCADEVLSSLKEIRCAQEEAGHVIQDFRSDPGQFGDDLLSPAAVGRYSRYYAKRMQPELAYPAGEKDDAKLSSPTSLFDLLSRNSAAGKACAEHGRPLPPHPLHQAFQTAGRIFQAIPEGGFDVIVPYGKEGEELVAELNADPDLRELPNLLRRAQLFSVHLFDTEWNQLNRLGAIDLLAEIGVAVLRKEFYDPQLGVQLHRGEMEILITGN